MKKFLNYSLGVLTSLSTLSCFAMDKFEELPDLPDPLAYAVQPVEAASVTGTPEAVSIASQSIGNEPNLVSVVLALVFVILLIYATGIIYSKLFRVGFKTLKKQQGEFAKSCVSVVSTTQLGNNKTLHVVELDGKRMLIGASAGAIQLIKDLGSINTNDSDEEFSHIEIPNIKIPKIEIPKIEIPTIGFSKLVTKTHKGIENVEKEDTEDSASENNPENENSDVIIDSLFSQKEEHLADTIEEPIKSEHVVDPDDFVLYKKYLG